MSWISSRLPGSLRWRLTAWVAAVMLVSVAAIFIVVYDVTGSELRGQIDRDLSDDADQLVQAVSSLSAGSDAKAATAVTRYVQAQPYSASSTLLFALLPDGATAGNHQELFGAARRDPAESQAEQDRENQEAAKLRRPRLGYSTMPVPDVGEVRILERPVTVAGVPIVVGSGQPLATVHRAQRGVARSFLFAGSAALALALVASYLAGARVSRPLRRMAAVAARVDAGDLRPRMDTASARRGEVQVLADSFNHMLDRLEEAFRGQREFVADASHELRTPLTVVRGQLEVLAAQPNPSEAEVRRVERLVQAEITRISRVVDDLLLLTQAEHLDFLRPEAVDVPSFVSELWDGISLTADRRFELGALPDGSLLADPDRLAQAVRNLARNAIEHTPEETGLVRLEVTRLPSGGRELLRFSVLDDGPGIPSAQRERVFERFYRTDPARSRLAGGAGLGLAIVRAISEAHGGSVRAGEPVNGSGARIELDLPGFAPTPSDRR